MTPDLSDLHHGNYERVACIVFCTLTPIFLSGRFLSRILSRQLGSDDWAALAACTCALACNTQTLVALSHGWGRHKQNLTRKQIQLCLLLHWTFQITYKLTVALNKSSLLLLYLRIMPSRPYRVACHTLLTLVALFALATSIAGIFQCVPVDKAWNKAKPGHCYNLVDAWYSNAVFSIVTDFLILFLPMRMVYKLQREQREKILLYAIFGVGIFVTFTSIMRFFALKAANSADTTYSINSGFWSIIEINVGVICICLPPLRALLARHFFPSSLPSLNTEPRYPFPSPPLSSNPSSKKGGVSRGRKSKRSKGGSGNGTGESGLESGSEEELVYFEAASESKAEKGTETRIIKMTEFEVYDRPVQAADRVHVRALSKPWEDSELGIGDERAVKGAL